MWTDPIVDELRAIRDEHAAQCGFDAGRMFEDICVQQEKMRAAGVKLVSLEVTPNPMLAFAFKPTAPANSLARPAAPG